MQLCNLNIIGQGKERPQNIQITQGIITAVTETGTYSKNRPDETIIHLENVIAFPGLINSHDHLDFNSFRPTGNRIYNNYAEWGKDIRDQNKETINAVYSWKGSSELFLQEGYNLSDRYKQTAEQLEAGKSLFHQPKCKLCGKG